jgi:hypothetical protein
MTSPDSAPTSTEALDVVEAPESTSNTINYVTQEQEIQTTEPEVKDVEDFFDKGDIESLVNMENNSEAQVAAAVLMTDSYRHFLFESPQHVEYFNSLDLNLVSQELKLNPQDRLQMEENKKELVSLHEKTSLIKQKIEHTVRKIDGSWGEEKEALQKEISTIYSERDQLKEEQYDRYKRSTFPIRKAVLESPEQFPKEYRQNVIEGLRLSNNKKLLEEERELLREQYPQLDEETKLTIRRVVQSNIKKDLESFNIVPLEELVSSEAAKERLFLSSLGNPDSNESFIRNSIAPSFFPEEDPEKIVQSWEILKQVTPPTDGYKTEYSFFVTTGGTENIQKMNTKVFKEFMDNSEELIPTVSILKDYGFVYSPNDLHGKKIPGYLEKLKDLGKARDSLKVDLENIKELIPDYKYNIDFDRTHSYLEENPFSLANNQVAEVKDRTETGLKKTKEYFNSLDNLVPERWRSGFLASHINNMCLYADEFYGENLTENARESALVEANKYVLDPKIEKQEIERFANNYFEVALEPRAADDNIQAAFDFCERCAGLITTELSSEQVTKEDSTWATFSLITSDIYRHPVIHGREEEGIRRAKRDLVYSAEAAIKIKDSKTREKAIENLIYGLTDPEIGDLSLAEKFATLIETPVLKNTAQQEIVLERQRAERGETITWKKMEKVKRSALQNKAFIKNLLGYGTEEGYESASLQYEKVSTQTSPPDYDRTYSEEKTNQLKNEVERIKDDFNVSINIAWNNLTSVLEKGRVISLWENQHKQKERDEHFSSLVKYSERRNSVEKLIGNRAKGGRNDPHPIYGAAFCPNGRDELHGGAGGHYGETFIVLKKDKIKNRTSFCYDDSFNGYSNWMLDWDGGVVAKSIHNLKEGKSPNGYVEAQILGGVTVDDIESINIPSSAFSKANEGGYSIGRDISSEIERLREEYPNIKFNIIKVDE